MQQWQYVITNGTVEIFSKYINSLSKLNFFYAVVLYDYKFVKIFNKIICVFEPFI